MTIKILHIFAPNYKHRYGGPIFDWQYAFSKWDNPQVQHLVLDYDQKKPLEPSLAFKFEISRAQYGISRRERLFWVYRLLNLLRTYQSSYDVIHFHILWWAGLLSARWADRRGIPTVYQSVLLGSDTPGPIREQRLGKVKAALLKHFSVILPISEPLAEDYYAHGYSNAQVKILMNSVDTDLFHPVPNLSARTQLRKKHGLPKDATILMFTGSLIERKGVEILVEGFLDALQEYPDLYLLLVGPKSRYENPSVDEGFVSELQSLIGSQDTNGRVQMTGLIREREKLAELYRAADIFVFPSRREGLPNVVLEAMASGLPVIATRLPVLKNVIYDGENGLLVPMEDTDAIQLGICRVKGDPHLAHLLGRCARETILQNHTFEQWQYNLTEIYTNLMC